MAGVKRVGIEHGLTLLLLLATFLLIPWSGLPLAGFGEALMMQSVHHATAVMALLPMLVAGMGFSPAVTLGVLAGDIGAALAFRTGFDGSSGLAVAILGGLPLAILAGWIGGRILERATGREMPVGLSLGLLANGLHPYLMDCLLGRNGGGLWGCTRQGIESSGIKPGGSPRTLDGLFQVRLGPFLFPLGTLLLVMVLALCLSLLLRSKIGEGFRCAGVSIPDTHAATSGAMGWRTRATMVSMILACLGQAALLQRPGAVLEGGATGQPLSFLTLAALAAGSTSRCKARVRDAITGVVVLEAFLLVVPPALALLVGTPTAMPFISQFFICVVLLATLIRCAIAGSSEQDCGSGGEASIGVAEG